MEPFDWSALASGSSLDWSHFTPINIVYAASQFFFAFGVFMTWWQSKKNGRIAKSNSERIEKNTTAIADTIASQDKVASNVNGHLTALTAQLTMKSDEIARLRAKLAVLTGTPVA